MSIREQIAYWCDPAHQELSPLYPRIPSSPVERCLLATSEIHRLLEGPWADEDEERRCGHLWEDFDRFIEGRLISVALDNPYRKPKSTYLARLDPGRDEVWEIRSRHPRRGIRVSAALPRSTPWFCSIGSTVSAWEDRSHLSSKLKYGNAKLFGKNCSQPTTPILGVRFMTTSVTTSFLSEILDDNEIIPPGKLAYFRERFRDRLYELVVAEFLKKEAASTLTRAQLARRIGRKPEQITRWLGAPGNWTLETVSDLMLAISKAEPRIFSRRFRTERRVTLRK